jgi:SAM-dependent methyltransferase
MTLENPPPEHVWTAGDVYEAYMGRWSRLVAREFIDWLDAPAGIDWLDVGCGTGAIIQTILERASPRSVKGVDPSPGIIQYTRQHVSGRLASFEIGDAQALPIDTASVDFAVSGLVLNFVANPTSAIAEMVRAVRAGGAAAVYVWDYAGEMQMLRTFWDAARDLDPEGIKVDEGQRYPICQPDPLNALFTQAGLQHVEVRSIEVPTDFRDFDDYWSPFHSGQAPAPKYTTSLDEPHRNALRDVLRSRLPIEADGTIHLIARAWAVRGSRS